MYCFFFQRIIAFFCQIPFFSINPGQSQVKTLFKWFCIHYVKPVRTLRFRIFAILYNGFELYENKRIDFLKNLFHLFQFFWYLSFILSSINQQVHHWRSSMDTNVFLIHIIVPYVAPIYIHMEMQTY